MTRAILSRDFVRERRRMRIEQYRRHTVWSWLCHGASLAVIGFSGFGFRFHKPFGIDVIQFDIG